MQTTVVNTDKVLAEVLGMLFGGSFFDQVEASERARIAGQEAGFQGLMRGENPGVCPACKRQWDLGWVEGDALRQQRGVMVVELVLH